ncbi:NUDIX family hydrolase [Ligilactobacillus salitolerans]|uniref:NUDIX family hydrolase n=1 Tax=Ligilactobacillus salitolerans TaxID=1808352 RepID=A0A401ISI5_9LACO|nr:NUDIX domain-containing protein [Ligilactobacillus salitolerans]GBG94455.1 NUDIX family hydrolase [Ligilactobacillus salitolerans]
MQDEERLTQVQINIVNLIWSFDRAENQVNLLLVKRAEEPAQGMWSLPETFLGEDESADQGALRLVRDKIGLKLAAFHTEQLETFTAPRRVRAGQRVLSLAYMTFLPEMPPLDPGYGASDARWFSLQVLEDEYCFSNGSAKFRVAAAQNQRDYYQALGEYAATRPESLAFDHEWIIKIACLRIKNKLDYQPNILLTLGQTFTLKEARCVYAPFLKTTMEHIDNSNFKKTHGKLFEETGTVESRHRGRPANLYRLR